MLESQAVCYIVNVAYQAPPYFIFGKINGMRSMDSQRRLMKRIFYPGIK